MGMTSPSLARLTIFFAASGAISAAPAPALRRRDGQLLFLFPLAYHARSRRPVTKNKMGVERSPDPILCIRGEIILRSVKPWPG